ncbi:MAG: hypothetical protein GF330_06805, partial [Candidatus Eisenbacteria bacterium]|nr:hypothetical protein [Candidatus Eisenbacteria bacterium]
EAGEPVSGPRLRASDRDTAARADGQRNADHQSELRHLGRATRSRVVVALLFSSGAPSCSPPCDCEPHGCPCGRRLDPRGGCTCSPRMVARYLSRVSGPLLERIDIQHEMCAVAFGEMVSASGAEDSAAVRERVMMAWERQRHSFRDHPRVLCNAQMSVPEISSHCRLPRQALGFLRVAMSRLQLSPRAFHRVLRLARTIADLAGSEGIAEEHVAEAIAYRVLDRGGG